MGPTPDTWYGRPVVVDAREVRVEHRPAGRELQVGGTSASWYQPGRLLTGSVWDALAVPIAVLPPERRREVLILGLGGGSAARLLRAAAPAARIVGVELEAGVVEAARAHFDLDELALDVRIADARRFVDDDDARYDLVVEDCFVGGEGGLEKPPWLPEPGLDAVAARVATGGVLVCDAIHEVAEVSEALRRRFASVVRIELLDCVNQVFVASDRPLSARPMRRAVGADPVLGPALGNLRFRTVGSRCVREV